MRLSPLKTPLAVLRKYLGENIANFGLREFAKKVGCKQTALQNAELKRRPLSDELALRISDKTGISISWLLGEEPKAPMTDRLGLPYSMATYRQAQTPQSAESLWHTRVTEHGVAGDLAYLASDILQLLSTTAESSGGSEYLLLASRVRRAVRKMMDERGVPAPPVDATWIRKLQAYFMSGKSRMEGNLLIEDDSNNSFLKAAALTMPEAQRAVRALSSTPPPDESRAEPPPASSSKLKPPLKRPSPKGKAPARSAKKRKRLSS